MNSLIKITIGKLLLICSLFDLSASEINEFEPYVFIDSGIAIVTLEDYESYGNYASEDTITFKIGIGYQFLNEWSVSFNGLSKADYQVQLSSIDLSYNLKLTKHWKIDLSGGVLYGTGDEPYYICGDSGMLAVCTPETGYKNTSETTYVFGTSFTYDISENWGAKFGYKLNGYREGVSQTELLLQYRF